VVPVESSLQGSLHRSIGGVRSVRGEEQQGTRWRGTGAPCSESSAAGLQLSPVRLSRVGRVIVPGILALVSNIAFIVALHYNNTSHVPVLTVLD
jgi:hypothetical protein